MLRSEFATKITEGLGTSFDGTRDFIVKWMSRENTHARWNPLATTQPMAGDDKFNGVGVRNYPDLKTGVEATIKTLHNGHYPRLVHYLTTGEVTDHHGLDHELQTWSGNGYTFGGVQGTTEHDVDVAGSDTHHGGGNGPSWYNRILRVAKPLLTGDDVKHVQKAVGAPVDGAYGPVTEGKVRAFQSTHNLPADGVVGPNTAAAIG